MFEQLNQAMDIVAKGVCIIISLVVLYLLVLFTHIFVQLVLATI
jgi:hypothetical protein